MSQMDSLPQQDFILPMPPGRGEPISSALILACQFPLPFAVSSLEVGAQISDSNPCEWLQVCKICQIHR